jgi:hypothetical protein
MASDLQSAVDQLAAGEALLQQPGGADAAKAAFKKGVVHAKKAAKAATAAKMSNRVA